MDGIAIAKENVILGEEFSLSGEIKAGDNLEKKKIKLKAKEAVLIMTGAPLPKGAKRVIPKECLEKTGKNFKITSIPQNTFFTKQGEEAKKNQSLFLPFQIIDERLQAFMIGKTKIKVFAPPSIAILSTGNEIVDYKQKT